MQVLTRALVAAILSVPAVAAAQTVYEESFDTWDSDCITFGSCESTDLAIAPTSTIAVTGGCPVPGSCIDIRWAASIDTRLTPFPPEWAPSPNGLTTTMWLYLDSSQVSDGEMIDEGFIEILRAYCNPEPCNILLELHRHLGETTELVWQLEGAEDVVDRVVCEMDVEVRPGWHHIHANVTWSTAGDGTCTLQWDDTAIGMSASFLTGSDEVRALDHVVLGGIAFTAPAGDDSQIMLDEVCIGSSPADCEPGVPPPPVDGGPTPPPPGAGALVFRGGGGCTCRTSSGDSPSSFGVLFAMGALIWLTARARAPRPPRR